MKILCACLVALSCLSFPAYAQPAVAPQSKTVATPAVPVWIIDRPRSSIQMKSFKDGKPFTVVFQSWSGEIAFDPAHPERSSATITVDTRSGSMGKATFKEYLVTPSWFDPEEVPYAQFHMSSFSKMNETTYQANGVLNLYNQAKTVLLPFPGIGIPFQAKFIENKKKKKPLQAEFTSNFTFAVPDFSETGNTAAALKRPPKKINYIMVLKATQPPQKPSGK